MDRWTDGWRYDANSQSYFVLDQGVVNRHSSLVLDISLEYKVNNQFVEYNTCLVSLSYELKLLLDPNLSDVCENGTRKRQSFS